MLLDGFEAAARRSRRGNVFLCKLPAFRGPGVGGAGGGGEWGPKGLRVRGLGFQLMVKAFFPTFGDGRV